MDPMLLALAMALLIGCEPMAIVPQRNSPAASRQAWDALDAGRIREAAAMFDELLRKAPTDPRLLLGAGIAAHQLGDRDSARRHLGEAVRHDPTLTPASLLLGDVLYASGDLLSAIATYEAALAHAPDHKILLSRLEAWRRELSLHDRFAQKLGEHFTVLFEGPAEAPLAARAVEILEAAYWRIGSSLNLYPADVITVVLYTREQFRDITRAPDWAGGAYDGRIRVPVQGALANLREFERVLAHEFVHALVRTVAPRGVPQWLNEGLAMNFDGTDVTAMAAKLQGAPLVPALSQLEGPFSGLDRTGASLAYARSAVAVRQLLDDTGPWIIAALLEDLARGRAIAEAFERHTGWSYAEFSGRRAP